MDGSTFAILVIVTAVILGFLGGTIAHLFRQVLNHDRRLKALEDVVLKRTGGAGDARVN